MSHHGSEHYCPWSLLRVYGNSMVEEYEEHESSQDDTPSIDEDVNTSSNTNEDETTSQGILKSATDAVLNFVKQTAKKLVNAREQTNLTHNATINITKYPEDSSTQTQPPKTIVQLMPREDYEASCHGDSYETPTTCSTGSGCGPAEYVPNSYQAFLEIVHNICSRNMKNAEACFTNFSKILVKNATNGKTNLSKSNNERSSGSARNEDRVQADSQMTPEQEGHSQENNKVLDSTSSDVLQKQQLKGDRAAASGTESALSEDMSASKLVHIDETQSSSDNAITSTVLPSGTGSQTSVEVRNSVTSSVAVCDFDCASPLTPLAQPPLAVNDEPDLDELPTLKPGTDLENTIPEANSNSSKSAAIQENIDSSKSSETISIINASPTSTIPHETILSSSIITESLLQASEKISIQSQDAGQDAVNGNTDVHESLPGGNREYEQGITRSHRGDKEHEDIPNSHVDVLKTLTDAKTKEGTAEPEHGNEEPAGDDSVQRNENIVNSAEEERELGKPNSDGSGSTEKDVKAVEAQEVKTPGFGFFLSTIL